MCENFGKMRWALVHHSAQGTNWIILEELTFFQTFDRFPSTGFDSKSLFSALEHVCVRGTTRVAPLLDYFISLFPMIYCMLKCGTFLFDMNNYLRFLAGSHVLARPSSSLLPYFSPSRDKWILHVAHLITVLREMIRLQIPTFSFSQENVS